MIRLIVSAFLGMVMCLQTAQAGEGPLSDIVDSEVEKIAGGFRFIEGPVWHKDGYLLFSDIFQNKIIKWIKKDTTEVWRDPSGRSNGLTFDLEGRLIACEHTNRRVSRTEKDGSITVIADRYRGKSLNSPNDCVVRSDGTIFFTDPTYGIWRKPADLEFRGVYRVKPGEEPVLLVSDAHDPHALTFAKEKFAQPNGLAFSPDEKTLYVGSSSTNTLRAFTVADDGSLSDGKVIAEPYTPDGMKVDIKGRLFVTSREGIIIYDASGTRIGVITVPEQPANCAFGDQDNRTLYITARTGLYKVRLKTPGIKVWR